MKKLIIIWCIIAASVCNISAMKKNTKIEHTSARGPHIGLFLFQHMFDEDKSTVYQQVKKMLESGAKVDAPNPKTHPALCHPLFLVSSHFFYDEKMLALLLKHHKNPNLTSTRQNKKMTLLSVALRSDSIKKAKVLLDHGANPNDGISLFSLIDDLKFNHLALLFAHGATPKNKHYKTKETFGHTVSKLKVDAWNSEKFSTYRFFRELTKLVSSSIKLTWNNSGTKNLCPKEDLFISLKILLINPDINPAILHDEAGLTFLHYAIIYRDLECAEVLIMIGANPFKRCCYGLSPYDIYSILIKTDDYQRNPIFEIRLQCPPQHIIEEKKQTCPICRKLITGNAIYSLCCKHLFHLTCVDEWYESHKSCPNCKTEL